MHDEDIPLSKTKRKQQSHDLQKLGERLVTLRADQLKPMHLPENLVEAVLEAKRIKSFGALSRQMQYIGRLMRDIDPAPIQARLEEMDGTSRTAVARHHQLEQWRDRLLEDDRALDELLARFPHADRQHLRTLAHNARKEVRENKPPRMGRALFRELRALFEEQPATADENSVES